MGSSKSQRSNNHHRTARRCPSERAPSWSLDVKKRGSSKERNGHVFVMKHGSVYMEWALNPISLTLQSSVVNTYVGFKNCSLSQRCINAKGILSLFGTGCSRLTTRTFVRYALPPINRLPYSEFGHSRLS